MALVQDFTDYNWFARSDDVDILKDFIVKLHTAYLGKDSALRTADAKIEHLNANVLRQEALITDLNRENKRIREEMTVMTNNITEMEDNFARWQATLIKQGDEERKLIANDSAKKQAKLTEKVQALEESLQVAADEITRLSITVAELNDTTAYVTTIASQSENLMANTDKEYIAKVSELEQDNKDLTEQIIDITRRRMKLQTQYDKMEEESEKLKLHIKKATETITSLMTENGTLKERQRRFSKAEIIMEEITLD